MTTICIVPERRSDGEIRYYAATREQQSAGRSPGEALDALSAQLSTIERGTLVIVQEGEPDRYFSRQQQERLADLMARWRAMQPLRFPPLSSESSKPSSMPN